MEAGFVKSDLLILHRSSVPHYGVFDPEGPKLFTGSLASPPRYNIGMSEAKARDSRNFAEMDRLSFSTVARSMLGCLFEGLTGALPCYLVRVLHRQRNRT